MAVAEVPTARATPTKELYEIGEIPPLGHVPEKMYAWAIRKERHGPPEDSFKVEVLPTWDIADDEVLVLVMAAGVNYNGVWAGLGTPISPIDGHKNPYHVAGSDASGIVWAIGDKVKRWKVGDEIIIHCNQDDGDDDECNGGDPLLSPSQRIWGYETPDGSFAQFCRVQSRQLMPKPKHLTWEESACYTLTLATAYRMLFGHAPHTLKPGDNVLIWGASGGLGVFGVQLVAASGANAIAIVSDKSKAEYVFNLGAKGVIYRNEYKCWGQMPKVGTAEYNTWLKEARQFGKAIWEITGKRDVDIVFEHPGEQTFPVSCLVVKRGGMVVFCAGTTGYNLTFDARYVWMRQKRIQGSHFARLFQVCEVRALNALLAHPHIARIEGEVVTRGAGAEHHHAAALHHEARHRERLLARMLEHDVDVALAGDLPDCLAELARFLEPRVVFGRVHRGHLAPA